MLDDSAMFGYAHPKLRTYRTLVASAGDSDLAWLERQVARIDPQSPAFIVYTSGTTGHPKGALVAHGKHLAATANIVEHYPTLAQDEHRTIAYLPLCHVLGRDVAVTLPLISRLVPHFGEDLEDLPTTLFEVAPTVLFTVPRYLQKFGSQVLLGILNSSAAKRIAADVAIAFARKHARARWTGRPGLLRETLYRACRAGVFMPILNKLGFDRLELVICAGAPLPPDTMALWHMLGVNVTEMYGQTETAGGIISGQRGPFPRPGDVGTVPAGWQVRLADDGEVLVSSPDLFDGYWNNAEATRATKAVDGFCAPETSANGATGRCAWSTVRATSSSPRVARRSRRRSSRRSCAGAPMWRRRSCSATAASISPRSSRSTPTRWRTGRATTTWPIPASPASPPIPTWCG